jgi:hypothetical protein
VGYYQLSHYGIDTEQPLRRKAFFHAVKQVDGGVKPMTDKLEEMDLALHPDLYFDTGVYYAIESNELGKLSAVGWHIAMPAEIKEAENVRITEALSKGENPLPLTGEQQAHNERSLRELEDFLRRKKKSQAN